ncbi:MAG: hypothetical protein QOH61_2403 [Chloroflexota bacterium]|nr:hypothetical protein [Chloroflexota bacterium]
MLKVDFVECGPERLPEIVEIMADGFRDDPVMTWIMGGEESRREVKLRRFFTLMAGTDFLKDHRLFVSADGGAASIWARPDRWRTTTGDQLRALPGFLGLLGLGAVRAMRAFAKVEAQHPKPAHWFLMGLAVRRDRQGQGLGAACLADGLARMPDAAHMATYLESSNPRNFTLYERAGFQIAEQIRLGGPGNPVVTTMWRDER